VVRIFNEVVNARWFAFPRSGGLQIAVIQVGGLEIAAPRETFYGYFNKFSRMNWTVL
jgi:hypothetical protein